MSSVGSKCTSEWLATISVTRVQNQGMKMGVVKKRNTLKYYVLRRLFFFDIFGWRSCEKRTFGKLQSNFIGIHITFVKKTARWMCVRTDLSIQVCVWDIKLRHNLQRATFFIFSSLIIGCSTLLWFTTLPKEWQCKNMTTQFRFYFPKKNIYIYILEKNISFKYISWFCWNL
jgi:hypothetical protein